MLAVIKFFSDGSAVLLPGFLALLVLNRRTFRPPVLSLLDSLLVVTVGEWLRISVQAVDWSAFGSWEATVKFSLSLLAAALVGWGAAYATVKGDDSRRGARGKPSAAKSIALRWHQIFRAEQSHVVLHMKDGRQIHGWPEGWPDDPVTGHFLLTAPTLKANGRVQQLEPDAVAVLLPASDVSWVQFLSGRRLRPNGPFGKARSNGMNY